MKVSTKNLTWSQYRLALIYISFLLVTFGLYREGIIAVPRGDHVLFMAERSFAQSEWDYFWNSLSYNRTRKQLAGDFYLFRPGTTGLLALLDIAFRSHFYILGIFSLFFHSNLCFLLFRLLSKFISWKFALLFSGFFLVQYTGIEMIMWRHISPYILGIFFFLLAIMKMMDSQNPSRKNSVLFAGVFFFFATLFHEASILAAPVCGILYVLLFTRNRHGEKGRRLSGIYILTCTGLPTLVYGLLSLASFIYYNPSVKFMGSEIFRFDFQTIVLSCLTVLGYFGFGFFLPEVVRFVPGSLMGRANWHLTKIPLTAFLVIGAVLFLLWGIALLVAKKKKSRDAIQGDGLFWILGSLSIYLFAVLTGVAVLRIGPRHATYLSYSTYYLYFGNFLLSALIPLFTQCLWNSPLKFRKVVKTCCVLLLINICYSAINIQKVLREIHPELRAMARVTESITTFFKSHSDFCFGGLILPVPLVPDIITVQRYNCELRVGTPLYATLNPNCRPFLSSIPEKMNMETQPLLNQQTILLSSGGDTTLPDELMRFMLHLSPSVLNASALEVRAKAAVPLVWVINFHSNLDFIAIVHKSYHTLVFRVQNGSARQVLSRFTGPNPPLHIRAINTEYGISLFNNSIALGSIENVYSLEGKTGVALVSPELVSLLVGRSDNRSVFSLEHPLEISELTESLSTYPACSSD